VTKEKPVERVQTGIKIEKRILKVMKGLAEYHDLSVGDLLEALLLHAFEGKVPLTQESIRVVRSLRDLYGLDLRPSAGVGSREAK
jgi:hypothetical protein